MAEEQEWIVLIDEENKEHRFTLLEIVDLEGRQYAILLPEDQTANEEPEAVIFRLETGPNDQEVLVNIDDPAEFERVREIAETLLNNDLDDGLS